MDYGLLSGFAVIGAVTFSAAGYYIFSRPKYRGTLNLYAKKSDAA